MSKKSIIISSLISCVLLYIIEQVIQADYLLKTFAKVLLFTLIPYFYIRFSKRIGFKEALNIRRIDKNQFKLGLLLGLGAFITILVSYYVLKDYLDLNQIASELQSKSKITPFNFIFIGFYIIFGNSFLEEFFFRGFIFLNLYEAGAKKTAYIFSSLLFGVYHIAIFQTWFNIWLILLALAGLVTVGLLFNWIDTKSKNFINSWLVHIFADIAIILIGLRMFNII